MKIFDLSQPLFDACPNCPVHPPVKIEVIASHARDGADAWHMETLSFASHTGSHVDAPLHKLQGGRSIDAFGLEAWTGPARIVDLRGIAAGSQISAAQLAAKLGEGRGDGSRDRRGDGSLEGQWILLATGWGDKREKTPEWLEHSPVLSAEGARWLVERNARGVGIDHFSIGDGATHAILLAKPVLIVEELHFSAEVLALKDAGEFWGLPINLKAHSGAPCRPVLIVR